MAFQHKGRGRTTGKRAAAAAANTPSGTVLAAEQAEIVLQGGHPPNLVGVAISGGGIRSATFGLGVLEGLREQGRLESIDYISTVSGGGFTGSWLTANCLRHGRQWLSAKLDWNDSIDHLRRYSNYLSPQVGFFSADTWTMAATWVRNAMLMLTTVVLFLATVLLAPRILHQVFLDWPYAGNWRSVTLALFLIAIVGVAGNHLRLRSAATMFLSGSKWPAGLACAIACFGLAWFIGRDFEPFTDKRMDVWPAVPVALFLVTGGFCLQPVGVRLFHAAWRGDRPPERINYSQPWVQWLVVIPLMGTGFYTASILWHDTLPGGPLANIAGYSSLLAEAYHYWLFSIAFVLAVLWLLSICALRDRRDPKCVLTALWVAPVCTAAFYAMMCGVILLQQSWTADPVVGGWYAFMWTPVLVLYGFSLVAVLQIGLLGRASSDDVREWWSRLGAWLAIYGIAWMVVAVTAVYGPKWSAELLASQWWQGASVAGGWIGTTVTALLAGHHGSTGKPTEERSRNLPLEVVAKVGPFVFIAGLLLTVGTGVYLVVLRLSGQTWTSWRQLADSHWHLFASSSWMVAGYTLLACAAGTLLLVTRLDINEFSLNAFYRNRLTRCYLGATRFDDESREPQNFTGFDACDDVDLCRLQYKHGYRGPLHLVNCALNLGGTSDLDLHTRHSASFTLSPLYCGSSYVVKDGAEVREMGYISSEVYAGSGRPTLGQAVSVSGAAASPNMGYHTSPPVAFLLTVFNVRLGWWFPNPLGCQVRLPSPWLSLRYLLNELFGGAGDRSTFLMVSDGGHFENLGVYELVRRKCKVIIAADGECDSRYQFGSLGALIRMCQVDFGATVDLNVDAIRPDPASGVSQTHCASGRIYYADGSTGTLIYLKASLTGEEDTAVHQYRSAHPAFPHESTGDQFYGEDQFESYRSLGRHVVEHAFKPVQETTDWTAVAERLADYWHPSLATASLFAGHSRQLGEVWARLGAEADLGALDQQLIDRPWPCRDEEKPAFRRAYYLCCELIQLMEAVYMDLRLDETWDHPDNAGWRNLFRAWSQSKALRSTWQMTSHTYGRRFQHFCESRLGLSVEEPRTRAAGGSS